MAASVITLSKVSEELEAYSKTKHSIVKRQKFICSSSSSLRRRTTRSLLQLSRFSRCMFDIGSFHSISWLNYAKLFGSSEKTWLHSKWHTVKASHIYTSRKTELLTSITLPTSKGNR